MQQSTPSEETQALLARLASRPGVQSTLILSRDTGAIVQSSGLNPAMDADSPDAVLPVRVSHGADDYNENTNQNASHGTRTAEQVARLVFTFVKSVGDMVHELNGSSDEARLVRLRTKRNEVVIVPDSKYLLVVVHDTPPA